MFEVLETRVLPNVTTMNVTSNPSSRTPLNATANEYQSMRAGCAGAARLASSRSRANAAPSSCSGL